MAAPQPRAPRLSAPERVILTVILGAAFVTFPLWFPFYLTQAIIRQRYRERQHRRLTRLPRPLALDPGTKRSRRLSISEQPPTMPETIELSSRTPTSITKPPPAAKLFQLPSFLRPQPSPAEDPEKAIANYIHHSTPMQSRPATANRSLLLSLPPEIRAMIFRHATFSGTLHILAVVGQRRLMAVPCAADTPHSAANIHLPYPSSCAFCCRSPLKPEFKAYYYPKRRRNHQYQSAVPGWYYWRPEKATQLKARGHRTLGAGFNAGTAAQGAGFGVREPRPAMQEGSTGRSEKGKGAAGGRNKAPRDKGKGMYSLGLLNLPLVSRGVYRETIRLVYSQPRFQPVHPDILPIFKNSILSERYEAITRIKLLILLGPAWQHQFPGGEDEANAFERFVDGWGLVWRDEVATMPRLKVADCELRSPTRFVGWHDERVRKLMESVQGAMRRKARTAAIGNGGGDGGDDGEAGSSDVREAGVGLQLGAAGGPGGANWDVDVEKQAGTLLDEGAAGVGGAARPQPPPTEPGRKIRVIVACNDPSEMRDKLGDEDDWGFDELRVVHNTV